MYLGKDPFDVHDVTLGFFENYRNGFQKAVRDSTVHVIFTLELPYGGVTTLELP